MSPGLRRALMVPVVLFVVALLAVNGVLNLWLPGVINEAPERTHVRWGLALTLWPGHVRVWGLRAEGTGRMDRWSLDLPYASGTVDLGALSSRTFRATGLFASGGRFEYALRDDPEPDRPRAPSGPWTIDLPGLHARHMTRIAVGTYRFDGLADLSGDLRLGDDVDLALALGFTDGGITVGNRPLLSALKGNATTSLVDFPRFSAIGPDTVERSTGSASLVFHADDLGMLAVYLQKLPWLQLSGEAEVTLVAALDGGVLAPGSHAEAVTTDLSVGFRSYRVVGDATMGVVVAGTPEVPEASGRATLGRFRILDDQGTSMVRGAGFEVHADAGALAWSAPSEDLRVRLVLPDSELENPDAWARFLPAAAGVTLTEGSGTVHGELHADAGAGTARGSMHLAAADVAMGYDASRMISDITLDVELPEADLANGAYTFSGSAVRLLRFGDPRDPSDPRDWWANLVLERGVARSGEDASLDADLSLECKSSGPMLDVADERGKVPGVVERLLTVRDLRGRATLQIRDDAVLVRGLLLEGGSAEVRMDLLRRSKQTHGAVFARVGPLSIGIGLEPGNRTWHPLGARSWFEANDVFDGVP